MIKRYFTDDIFKRVNTDFAFLMKLIKSSKGELDFAIRDDYFNLYYKGNSLAKVSFKKNEGYEISIHKAFFSGSKAEQDKRFNFVKGQDNSGNYFIGLLKKDLLHPFFQQKYLYDFCRKIKSHNYGEEIVFEQNLITDNINKENVLFIDRQITDNVLKGKRMDLLALKQVEADNFQFLVCEVKLGNNPELKIKVASQLNDYLSHINDNFKDYKACYEKQYEQKKELGLFDFPNFKNIKIIPPVEGLIIVGGYSGIAKVQIDTLRKNYPNLSVRPFFHELP